MTEIKFDISNIKPLLDALNQLSPDAELTLTNGVTPIARVNLIQTASLSLSERVPDLRPPIWLSDDFDDLLPDHYWKTREA